MRNAIRRLASAAASFAAALALALAASCGGSSSGGGDPEMTAVALSRATLEFVVGGAPQALTATVEPSNAAGRDDLTWSVEPAGIVALTPGTGAASSTAQVAPVAEGDAVITVAAPNGVKATCTVTVIESVPVTDVMLSQTSMSLGPDDTGSLTATVLPTDATNKSVAWTVAPGGIVNMVPNGLNATVTAVAPGTAVIKVTTDDGGHYDECTVTVASSSVPVTGVTVLPTTLSLAPNGTGSLTATVLPAEATNKNVTWTVAPPTGIVNIAPNGLSATVTGVAVGNATITVASAADPTKKAECIVTVAAQPYVPVTGVAITPSSLDLTVGGAPGALVVTVSPENATDKGVTWTDNPNGVVMVGTTPDGLNASITAVADGSTVLTVTTDDGGHAASCTVTVGDVPAPSLSVFMATRYGLFRDGKLDTSHGSQIMGDVTVDSHGNVHAVGRYNDAAAYYLNGVRTMLPTTLTMEGRSSGATGVFVTDSDHVYVTGYERTAATDQYIARLWVDGAQYPLQGISDAGTPRSRANAVCVRNGDIYVGGGIATSDTGTTYNPAIWKNGTRYDPTGNGFGGQYIIDLGIKANGGLAVLCSNYSSSSTDAGSVDTYARGWNAMKFLYDIDAALATATEVTLVLGDGNMFGLRLHVDGDDVYVSGETYQYAPIYWKNGVKVTDYARPGSSSDSGASIVRIHEGHVYVSGYGVESLVRHLGLWIDDVLVEWPWEIDAYGAISYGDAYALGLCIGYTSTPPLPN